MFLVAGIVAMALIRERLVRVDQWQVSVTGQGRVSYVPDIANINLEVLVEKKREPSDAVKELNEKVKKVYEAIKKSGVAEGDIQVLNYTLSPQYDLVKEVSTLTGYSANQSIMVKVRGIDQEPNKAAAMLSAGNNAGVNRINGIGFEASNENELKNEARLKAIADARSKAGKLGEALGVELGRVVGWWENYIGPAAYDMAFDGKGGLGAGGGGAGEPVIASGAREIVIEANVNYLLED
jgi:hypothetical protein